MAITYPRELPSYKLSEGAITLVDSPAMSASDKGKKINISQVVDPTWTGVFTTGMLYPHEAAVWAAWKNSLRGGQKRFLAYDVRRSAPLAYPDAKAPGDISAGWAGTATITALGAAGALGLSGLPAGYQIKAGDRIGIVQGSPARYGYYEAAEDVTASAGGLATITVAPFLHTNIFAIGSGARLWQPKCQFVINSDSFREPTLPGMGDVSFTAFQRI